MSEALDWKSIHLDAKKCDVASAKLALARPRFCTSAFPTPGDLSKCFLSLSVDVTINVYSLNNNTSNRRTNKSRHESFETRGGEGVSKPSAEK